MENRKKIGVIVGVLYIMGTVFGIASVALMNPLSNADSYLLAIAGNNLRYICGVIAVLLMGVPLSFIPIFLFPILIVRIVSLLNLPRTSNGTFYCREHVSFRNILSCSARGCIALPHVLPSP